VKRLLVMWDIDHTLLRGGGVAGRAWKTAFTAVTGREWQVTPNFAGRTDLDICAEVFASHGVTDCTPDRFFARYVTEVDRTRHLFAEQGALLPGVPEVLSALAARGDVVQTLVTGNVPQVAAAKLAAFDLTGAFDAEVGAYGTDDSVRATLVRRSRERAEAKYGAGLRPVVIGDTAHDVAGARANNARVIAVATGSHDAAHLHEAGADVVLDDLSDTPAAVAAITS
jgi:phosphoglycolate phosphatase